MQRWRKGWSKNTILLNLFQVKNNGCVRKVRKRLKSNRCPEFDCRSKKRTKQDDPILDDVYKCNKCGRLYIPGSHPTKLWHLWYRIRSWFKWDIPYKLKSKEKHKQESERLQKSLKEYFNSPEGEARLERNNQKIQREVELNIGWFSPEEDEAWGTVENPCPKCANDCKYFYKIGRTGADFRGFYGSSCREFVNKRNKKTIDFTLNKLIYNLKNF